jgi:hypothetical protein
MDNFNWISDYVKKQKTFQGLDDLLPNLFDKYFLIPWNVGIIDCFPFTDYPDNKDSIENLNKQHSIEKEFGIFLNDNTEGRYRKATLKEIAERFQVKYCADTAYLINATPGISTLLEATIQALKELIFRFQEGQILNLYIEDDFRFQPINENWKYKKENVKIETSDYLSFQEDTAWDSTSYFFPDRKDWCLCTVEDYQHFIFCCNNSEYKSPTALQSIEAFEIDYTFQINSIFG